MRALGEPTFLNNSFGLFTPKFEVTLPGSPTQSVTSAVRLADAHQAELAAEIGIGAVELGGAARLGDIFAVEADQHADGDAVVERRLAGEVDPDLLAHRYVSDGRNCRDPPSRRWWQRRRALKDVLRCRGIAEAAADGIAEKAGDAELQAACRRRNPPPARR